MSIIARACWLALAAASGASAFALPIRGSPVPTRGGGSRNLVMSALPKVVAFDLDATLWYCYPTRFTVCSLFA